MLRELSRNLSFFRRIVLVHEYALDMPTRIQIAIWVALLAIALILSLRDYASFQLGTFRDDGHYVILAQSLVQSDRYGLINAPGKPGDADYPFGYPLLLAPLVLLFPDHPEAIKTPSLIATLLNATLLFWGWPWFSRRSHWWAIAIIGLYILSPLTINQTRMVISEPIFITFCLVAILLAEQAARNIQVEQSRRWSLLMSATLMLVVFIRTIGMVLLVSIFVYLLFIKGRRFWKELALIVVQIIILVSLVVGMTSVEAKNLLPSRYVNEYASLAGYGRTDIETPFAYFLVEVVEAIELHVPFMDFLVENVEAAELHLESHIPQAVLPAGDNVRASEWHPTGIQSLLVLAGLLTSGLIFLGYYRWFVQEGISAFQLFTVLYLGALFVWPWRDIRFLSPIQPQLFLGLLLGLETILVWITSFRSRTGSLRMLLILVGAGAIAVAIAADRVGIGGQAGFGARQVMLALVGFTILLSGVALASPYARQFRNGVLAAGAFILMLLSAYNSLYIDDTRRHVGDLQARSSWLKANTTASDIVMTEEPQIDFLYSGRKTINYPVSRSSASELEAFVVKHDVDYILVAPRSKWQASYIPTYSDQTIRMLPMIENLIAEDRVKLVYSSERDLVKVFEVQP